MRTRPDTRLLRSAIVTLIVPLLALVAGCGGDDETTATTEPTTDLPTGTLSKSELVSEADALCTETSERIAGSAAAPDFGEDGPQPEEVEASAPYWSATAAESEVLLEQLSQLQPPKSEQQRWEEFLELLEAGTVGYATALQGPAEDGDPDAFYQAALDSQRDLLDLARAAKALGLKVCGGRDLQS